MIVPPLTANDVAIFQQGQREGALAMAAAVAVGGTSWTVKRASGSGRTSRPVEATVDTVTGYAYRARPIVGAVVASPDFIPAESWRWIGDGSPDIREDDTLVSVADSTLSFTVRTVERRSGYTLAVVA